MKNFREYESEVNAIFKEVASYEALAAKLSQLSNEENPYAIYYLGTLYENGNGVEQNNSSALSCYITADKMGLPQAKYQLGLTCEFGRCGVTQSYEVALRIYKEAADLGHSDAQCQIGGLYERGLGVEQSHETAAYYYRLASENGNERAKFLLADCYMKGLGVNKNVSEAINLFHQAADLGNGNSQLILALRYKYGDEVPLDYIKAYKYADLASGAEINDSDRAAAMGLRDEIYLLMSDKEKNSI